MSIFSVGLTDKGYLSTRLTFDLIWTLPDDLTNVFGNTKSLGLDLGERGGSRDA